MTRFLSQALNENGASFRRELMELEAANGHPNVDIRLSTEVSNNARNKCRELGLDPTDTTAEELYHALLMRVKDDDKRLTKNLRTLAATQVSAEADTVSGIALALKDLPDSKACFALKTAKLRTILKNLAPKKTMKTIGYRSIDSMLKHENVIEVLGVAWLVESASWQKHLLEQYKKLSPSDFEERSLKIIYSRDKRYKATGERIVSDYHHNIISLKELGAIVLLPLPSNVPEGVVTASLSLALNELNEIRTTSNYLKINQFKSNFGASVAKVSLQSPELSAKVFDRPVSWNLIQRYYTRFRDSIDQDVLEPYISLNDMTHHAVEDSLARIEPKLAFWRGTDSLGLIDNDHAVSLNVIDNAISLCNKLPFERRFNQYFENSLLTELLLRYFRHDSLPAELQPEYALNEADQ